LKKGKKEEEVKVLFPWGNSRFSILRSKEGWRKTRNINGSAIDLVARCS